MQTHVVVLCVVATFVLIYDHQKKLVAASSLHRTVRQAYSTRYDNFDIDAVLASKRLLLNYSKCLLDKGPCSPEGKELKKYIPDALLTECSKCSEIQKKQAGKVFAQLLAYHKDIWNELLEKYDPDGIFRKKYEDADYDYSELDSA